MQELDVLGAVDPTKQRVLLNADSPQVRELWEDPSAVSGIGYVMQVEYLIDSGQAATIVPEIERYPVDERRKVVLAAAMQVLGIRFEAEANPKSAGN